MRNIETEEFFGIEVKHHYGITTHELLPGETAEEAGYRLCRKFHTFLTDENHNWTFLDCAPKDATSFNVYSAIRVIKNENSGLFALKPSWVDDGPGATWFSMEFRYATRQSIDAEIDDLRVQAERYRATAAQQKDTIKGRKAAKQYLGFARSNEIEAEFIAKRWPQYLCAVAA